MGRPSPARAIRVEVIRRPSGPCHFGRPERDRCGVNRDRGSERIVIQDGKGSMHKSCLLQPYVKVPRMYRRLSRFRFPSLVGFATAALAGYASLRPDRALAVAPNMVSHQLCSAVFVAGLDSDSYYREFIAPNLSVLEPLVHYDIDHQHRAVTATFAGGFRTRAVYRGAEGCLVVQGPVQDPAVAPPPTSSLLPSLAGPDVVTPTDPALITALDHAFANPGPEGPRLTKAVVIVHDGRIVAERYAPGYGPETPILGWSMTKSVTNALIGILVREGKVSVTEPAPVAAWSAPTDPHHSISIDNLLRMTSGLKFGQSLTQNWKTAFDPTAQMVFATPDMAAVAERASVGPAPGAMWRYSNGNTMLLSRIVRNAAGGDAASVLRFAHTELFDKLGMTRPTLEFDAVGTPLGATHMWAPARDWARLGMLYLNYGVIGGVRILPAGWVDYSTRLTPGSEDLGYGAGFWTNRGDQKAAPLQRPHMPRDSFMAQGSLGQYVIIIPSAQLVIVRMGISRTPGEDIAGVDRLTEEAIAALAIPTLITDAEAVGARNALNRAR
jgi:CubicO group peptidase (beta-lactamase class C family)